MSDDTKQQRGGLPFMKILLVTSLALNLLFVGLVVGARFSDGPRERTRDAAMSQGPFGRALSEDARREIGQKIRGSREDRRRVRAEMRGQIERLIDALRAEPYDAAAVEAILSQFRAVTDERRLAGHAAFVDHVTTMSSEDRLMFADRLQKVMKRGRNKP